MQVWRRAEARDTTWPVTERLVVSISSSPSAMQIVRAGSRMAARLRAEWTVVWVDTPRQQALPRRTASTPRTPCAWPRVSRRDGPAGRSRPVEELLAYARRRNATRILAGKPGRYWWRDRLLGSFVDELVRRSGEIDVSVVSASAEPPLGATSAPASPTGRRSAGGATAGHDRGGAHHAGRPLRVAAPPALQHCDALPARRGRGGRALGARAGRAGVAAGVATFDFFTSRRF